MSLDTKTLKDEAQRLIDIQSEDPRMGALYRHEYLKVATPEAVLALIAENERLRENPHIRSIRSLRGDCADLMAERDQLRAEVSGLKTGYEAYERVNAELKAEVGVLRKAIDVAAARMIAAKECFDRDYPGEWSGELHLAVGIKEIDAALGQGEQS